MPFSAMPSRPPAREKIAPELRDALAAGSPATVAVIVVMQEQADLGRLNAEMLVAGVDRRARAGRVIPVLKDIARASQAGLRAELERFQTTGAVESVRSLWIANALLVPATAFWS